MKISTIAFGLCGLAAASSATVVRAFEDTVLTPGYSYGGTSSNLVYDPAFGAGHVAKFAFNLNGHYASAGIAFGFKDWGSYNFQSATSIDVYLKTESVRTVQISIKKGLVTHKDSLYDKIGSDGKGFLAEVEATSAGQKFTLEKADFDLPGWLISGGKPTDAGLKAWLGADSGLTYKNGYDTVMSDLKFIQIAIPCEQDYNDTTQNCHNDSGYVEIDSLVVNGVQIGSADWSDPVTNLTGIRTRIGASASQFRALVVGENLEVSLPALATRVELIRQDGSKVSSWSVSGSVAHLALPKGMENGKYIVVCDLPTGRQMGSVTIVR